MYIKPTCEIPHMRFLFVYLVLVKIARMFSFSMFMKVRRRFLGFLVSCVYWTTALSFVIITLTACENVYI